MIIFYSLKYTCFVDFTIIILIYFVSFFSFCSFLLFFNLSNFRPPNCIPADCHELRVLSLQSLHCIASVDSLASGCPALEELDLYNARNVKDSSVQVWMDEVLGVSY